MLWLGEEDSYDEILIIWLVIAVKSKENMELLKILELSWFDS